MDKSPQDHLYCLQQETGAVLQAPLPEMGNIMAYDLFLVFLIVILIIVFERL